MNKDSTKIVIIGAGPIGIEMAVALKKEGINYQHLEAGCIASTIGWYAPHTHFFSSPERISIADIPLDTMDQQKATREQYLKYLRSVTSQFNLDIKTFNKVIEIKKQKNQFVLMVARSSHGVGGIQEYENTANSKPPYLELTCEKIILAIGDMHTPKLLKISGEKLDHVSHYLEAPHKYYDKKVLIIGGRNSAIEAAIRLARLRAKVTISYRGKDFDSSSIKFWLLPEIKSLIKYGKIKFLPESKVIKIEDDFALVEDNLGERKEIETDFVLALTGYKQNNILFEQLGVELLTESKKPKLCKETMQTNVENVFVCGTAVAGSQNSGVTEFIETSHEHVNRIIAHLCGRASVKSVDLKPVGEREN